MAGSPKELDISNSAEVQGGANYVPGPLFIGSSVVTPEQLFSPALLGGFCLSQVVCVHMAPQKITVKRSEKAVFDWIKVCSAQQRKHNKQGNTKGCLPSKPPSVPAMRE